VAAGEEIGEVVVDAVLEGAVPAEAA